MHPQGSMLSIVTPAYREAENLPVLYQRLRAVCMQGGIEWEWIIIDDHSPDQTFEFGRALAKDDSHVRIVRFSRNFGSHPAIACGLHQARGDVVAIIAADLQDPPEVLPDMLAKWRSGASVVWAVRQVRLGESITTRAAARIYYWIMRYLVGLKSLPPGGADFVILDRNVVDAVNFFSERNVSILALITWVGFRQDWVPYNKQPRLRGRSGWTLRKKVKLLVDSVTSFSYLPIRFISWFGLMVAVLGFLYAIVITIDAFVGTPTEGWASLMVVVLIIGGLQMTMLGVLGEYIWRNLDEARRRPLYVIQDQSDQSQDARAANSAAETPMNRGR
jgi:polyisoprenyl-phosphate glycosyltransferase